MINNRTKLLLFNLVLAILTGCATRSPTTGVDVSRAEAYGLVQPVTPQRQTSPKIITDPDEHLEYQRRTGDIAPPAPANETQ